jgi:hypothetical protein
MLNASFVKSVCIDEAYQLLDMPVRKDFEPLFFEDLNAEKDMVTGIGTLQSNVILPRAKVGSNVRKLEIRLKGKYRPLTNKEQGYLNLYFDDVLINAYKLDNSAGFDITFEIDDIALKQENVFRYEYYYVPEGGLCQVNAAKFYAQVDVKKSYIKPLSYETSPSLSFFHFPENFQLQPVEILTDLSLSSDLVVSMAELIDILNPGESGIAGYVYPKISTVDNERILSNKTTSKIIISKAYQNFSNLFDKQAYIKFSGDKVLYESDELQRFFTVNYHEKLGFNQLFYYNGLPVMLINLPDDAPNTLYSLINSIRNQSNVWPGNVIIAHNDDSYYFDLRLKESNASPDDLLGTFHKFWGKYGLLVVVLLLIIAVMLLVIIYQKSKQSKEKVQHAE